MPTPLGKVTSASWFTWGCPSFSTASPASWEILQSWADRDSWVPYPWGRILALLFPLQTSVRGLECPPWSHGPGTGRGPACQTPRGVSARAPRTSACRCDPRWFETQLVSMGVGVERGREEAGDPDLTPSRLRLLGLKPASFCRKREQSLNLAQLRV